MTKSLVLYLFTLLSLLRFKREIEYAERSCSYLISSEIGEQCENMFYS